MRPEVWAQVSYTDFPVMIRQQRAAVDAKVRELSNSHIVYPAGPTDHSSTSHLHLTRFEPTRTHQPPTIAHNKCSP
jgi:hypothetical protein